MSEEFDRLVAEFDKFKSNIRRLENTFSTVDEMQEEIRSLEVSASAPDRSVTVTAGPGGSVTGLKLSNEAMRQQPASLAATIMSTLQQAVAESARKEAGIVAAHMGSSTPLGATEQALETHSKAEGTSKEDPRSQSGDIPTTSTRTGSWQPEADEDDEDFSRRSFVSGTERTAQEPGHGGSAGDAFLRSLFDDEEDRR